MVNLYKKHFYAWSNLLKYKTSPAKTTFECRSLRFKYKYFEDKIFIQKNGSIKSSYICLNEIAAEGGVIES